MDRATRVGKTTREDRPYPVDGEDGEHSLSAIKGRLEVPLRGRFPWGARPREEPHPHRMQEDRISQLEIHLDEVPAPSAAPGGDVC